MEDPVQFFSDESLGKNKCHILTESYDRSLLWETKSSSNFSPGIVENDEILVRQIFSPLHIDGGSGEVKVTAFIDAFDKGLSVNRLIYTTVKEVHEFGEQKAERDRRGSSVRKPQNRIYVGYIEAKSGDLREILEDCRRIFGVYDTALEDNIAHSDVCCLLFGGYAIQNLSPSAAKKARRMMLMEAFSGLIGSPSN